MSATAQVAPSAQKLILIVDDTPTNIGVISGALKDAYKTKIATNGQKALTLAAAEEKPDLILLDIMMPEMDGYEVCTRLKTDPATRDIPVIFLTGQTGAEDETRGFEVGAVDYVTNRSRLRWSKHVCVAIFSCGRPANSLPGPCRKSPLAAFGFRGRCSRSSLTPSSARPRDAVSARIRPRS